MGIRHGKKRDLLFGVRLRLTVGIVQVGSGVRVAADPTPIIGSAVQPSAPSAPQRSTASKSLLSKSFPGKSTVPSEFIATREGSAWAAGVVSPNRSLGRRCGLHCGQQTWSGKQPVDSLAPRFVGLAIYLRRNSKTFGEIDTGRMQGRAQGIVGSQVHI